MAGFVDGCWFNATSTGTGDFVVASAITGYQTPAGAGASNATVYRYRAQSADNSQWEIGYGAYTTASVTQARTTVLFNSSGTTSKINFTGVPLVALVCLAEDLATFPTIPVSVANGGTGDTGSAWTTYTPTITAAAGAFTTVSATGRYKTIGKTCFIELDITTTTIGTASNSITATLPNTVAAANFVIAGKNYVTGKSVSGLLGSGATTITFITYYDFTFPAVNGNTIALTGIYETA